MSGTNGRTLHLKTERVDGNNGNGREPMNGNGPATREHNGNGKKLMALMLQRVNREGQMYFVGADGPMKLLMRPTGESQGDQPLWQLYVTQTARR
jgi:hypothetical protein